MRGQSLDKIFKLRIIFTLVVFCFTAVPGCVRRSSAEKRRLLGSSQWVGEGARTPPEPHRGTLEPGTEPSNAHIGTWMATHPCLCPYGAGNGSSSLPMTPDGMKWSRKPPFLGVWVECKNAAPNWMCGSWRSGFNPNLIYGFIYWCSDVQCTRNESRIIIFRM